MSNLVISLDFELFWGVADSKSIAGYRRNIEGEWEAIPKVLELFRRYGIKATWATVGMLMCRDYSQWRKIRPSVFPGYDRPQCSTYLLDSVVRENPKLFFARPLVEQIIETPGQEVASHSYSHFFCDEAGATPEQFAADLVCAREIGDELGVEYRSFVFPRNQVKDAYLAELDKAGYQVFRGNPDHWLYRDGHFVSMGAAGRMVRRTDSYIPLSGNHVSYMRNGLPAGKLLNIPASYFLRPSSGNRILDSFHLNRVKAGMREAAVTDGIFHLWWHPHNFGANLEKNMKNLDSILQYYCFLAETHGMRSVSMADLLQGRSMAVMSNAET
jgi:peptidoglycan/xylan/chitin deacetylase (PgdA/CDA1 family)